MKANPHAVLQCAPDLRIAVTAGNAVEVTANGRSVACGAHGLAILDAFLRPVSMSAALAALGAKAAGAHDWVELVSTVEVLRAAGILLDPGAEPPAVRPMAVGADTAPLHVAMLDDRARTASFIAGIEETVRPGDVVLDVGTGTGVLAIAAARAGAKRVYAIEGTRIARLARENFRANGFEERITLLEGWSTAVELPERADVLVSELIGHDPLSESVVEVTTDALKRLLTPNARLVPSRLDIYGIALSMSKRDRERWTYTPASVRRWREWYGIDFGLMLEAARGSHTFVTAPPQVVKKWKPLADPVLLASINLKTRRNPWLEKRATVAFTEPGRLDAFAVFFDAKTGRTARCTTNPATADARCHWGLPVWILSEPLRVEPGGRVRATYRYDASGSNVRIEPLSR